MKTITSYPYATPADLGAIIKLLIEARPAERVAEFPSIEDVREFMGVESFQTNTRLWEDVSGRLIGFAIRDGSHLMFEFMPHHDDVVAQIMAWAETNGKLVNENRIICGCSDSDTERMALLELHGFVATADGSLLMARPLHKPIPSPQLPSRFTIRHLEGEHEIEALVALHRAAFGTENMTAESRLAMIRVSDYEPELDLIAVDPDGIFAAYCMCHINHEENRLTG